MNPPKRKIANKAADSKVLAIVMSRAIAPIIRKRPKAI
uniref:PDR3 n=1 Tax=Arundo donax TaxID=35708 RepID=A0A0A8ZKH5_ARUDO